MQFSTAILALTGLVASATAAAVPSPAAKYPAGVHVTEYPDGLPADLIPVATEAKLAKRANAGVFLCTANNWQGHCAHIVAEAGVCVSLSSDLEDLVSSAGVDSPAFCLFYAGRGCSDNEGHFGASSPGYSHLDGQGGVPNFNDRVSSYKCSV